MKSDPRIGAIAADCKVRIEHAVGMVCCVLMEFPEHARDGDVATVPDVMLEQWAMWSGEPGVLAAAIRARLCDDAGTVRAWEKHNGAALRKLESDVARKRGGKEADRPTPSRNRRADVARNSMRPRTDVGAASGVDVDVDVDVRTTSSADAAEAVPAHGAAASPSAPREALLARFADPTHRDAVMGYVRSAQFPESVIAHLARAVHAEGGGHDPADVGQALHEMRLNGVSRFGSRLFEGYLRRVKIGEIPPATADTGGPLDFERIDAVSLARQGYADAQQLCEDRGWAWRVVA